MFFERLDDAHRLLHDGVALAVVAFWDVVVLYDDHAHEAELFKVYHASGDTLQLSFCEGALYFYKSRAAVHGVEDRRDERAGFGLLDHCRSLQIILSRGVRLGKSRREGWCRSALGVRTKGGQI